MMTIGGATYHLARRCFGVLVWSLCCMPTLGRFVCGVYFLPFAIIADVCCDAAVHCFPSGRCMGSHRVLFAWLLAATPIILCLTRAHTQVGLCVCEHALRSGDVSGRMVCHRNLSALNGLEVLRICCEAVQLALACVLHLVATVATFGSGSLR